MIEFADLASLAFYISLERSLAGGGGVSRAGTGQGGGMMLVSW